MKTLIRQLLLFGAIFGLLWQGVAYASPSCADMQQEQGAATAAMVGTTDCMSIEKQSRDDAPSSKDMKAGCLAMVGCTSLVALDVLPLGVSAQQKAALTVSWATSPVLVGRNEAPIPDPPSILG